MEERIDVRGPWPVYIKGLIVVELVGQPRTITLEEARKIVADLEAKQ
jgi:hypothetical protein